MKENNDCGLNYKSSFTLVTGFSFYVQFRSPAICNAMHYIKTAAATTAAEQQLVVVGLLLWLLYKASNSNSVVMILNTKSRKENIICIFVLLILFKKMAFSNIMKEQLLMLQCTATE